VKLLEDLGLPKLTYDQTEDLCLTAEEAARKYIYSKVSTKKVEALNIATEVEGSKPVKLTIDVHIVLSSSAKDFDLQVLTDESVKKAFASAKEYLGRLVCHSKK
jgi:hypothetical protein